MRSLSEIVKDFVLDQGAIAVGISTIQTLAGGPPSVDLEYTLKGAQSAITFAYPIDEKYIEDFFKKKDFVKLEKATYIAYTMASGISVELATYLKMRGFDAESTASNRDYRLDVEGGISAMLPTISHRYLAVRSGIGSFGFSGNIIIPKYGSAIALGSVVTSAKLEPTNPIPKEDNYCDMCGDCASACPSQFIGHKEMEVVTMGGMEFSYRFSRNYYRCGSLCAGYVGLHPSKKWSTLSPSRRTSPKSDEDIPKLFPHWSKQFDQTPQAEGGFFHVLMDSKIRTTCAHCQFICSPDRKVRDQRLEWLEGSGVIIQHEDGQIEAVTPEDAVKYLESLPEDVRRLYEDFE